jgi:aldose 1-epimerase
MTSEITLTNNNSLASFSFDGGASLSALRLSSGNSERTLLSVHPNYRFENAWLFPFPNRLKNGVYSFEGQSYQFPFNDMDNRPNALHGFISDKRFEVLDRTKSQCTVKYEYDGKYDYYPFPFSMTISFELLPDALICNVDVLNTGKTNLPCGLGWHPYFMVEEGLETLGLKLSESTIVELDDLGIPTGKENPTHCFDESRLIKDTHLDDCFRLKSSIGQSKSELLFENGDLVEVWQDESLPFTQVYTHPTRKSIAIEPMSCGVNALNSGDGLIILSPNQVKSFNCGVKYFAN